MPSLAAVIVSRAADGPGTFRRLFGKFLRARFPARWYLAALLPVGLAFAAAGLYRLFGGMASGSGVLTLAFWAGLFAMNLLTGPTGEEPGWLGFALPRLLQKHSPVKSGLLLGLVWSFWHLPLWLTSGYAGLELLLYILFFNAGIVSLTLLMVWIFRRTGGSLLPMTLLHFTYNASAQLISPQGLGLGPNLPLFGWMAGLTLLVMLTVWAAGGFSNLPLESVRSPG